MVFITCSVILVIYIVAVIVCRRMDKYDLDRIATVPLCGKDGSFKYQITVVTGKNRGSGNLTEWLCKCISLTSFLCFCLCGMNQVEIFNSILLNKSEM